MLRLRKEEEEDIEGTNERRRQRFGLVIERNGEGAATTRTTKPATRPSHRSAGAPLPGSRCFPRLQIRLLRPPTCISLSLSTHFPALFGFLENVAGYNSFDFLELLKNLQAREEMSNERLRYLEAMVIHSPTFMEFLFDKDFKFV